MASRAARPSRIRRPRTLLALLAPILLVACLEPLGPRHDTVRLEIESSDGSMVQVITSNDFSRGINVDQEEVFLLREADTAWVTVPYAENFDLNDTGRFYVRAAAVENTEATVTLRILLDGELNFEREDAPITGAGIQYYYQTR